ncbi:MAG: plasmid recombination protein [Tannerella sp.]|jgi:FtsZ-binding cell division protein ZapB|nr:plasmid recombination protein [Tannerella sp.]
MGFVVLHIQKAKGNDAATSAHIERTVNPKNADKERTHLNKELIEPPEGMRKRTQTIQHRIETAGIKRKIGKNQVRAIRINLSGTPEDMQRIKDEGKLDEWCKDSMDWVKLTFGEKNVVAATLHLDEKTPHIHATVVTIVTGERRKAKQEQQSGKKKYRKKDSQSARLCADDVMTRDKMEEYQDTYALAIQKYGLQRGIKGSEARHISTTQFYRDTHLKNEELKESVDNLLIQEEQAKQELSRIKSEIKTDKLKSSAVDIATSAIDSIGSVFGSSKVKRQQQEIEELKSENTSLQKEIKTLKEQMHAAEKEHAKITDKLRQELKKIYDLFPHIRELLRIENLCRVLNFGESIIKSLLQFKPVGFKGNLYSPEYQRNFNTEHSVAKVEEDTKETNKFRLTIDNLDPTQWFRRKQQEFLQSIGIKQPKQEQKQGIKR